MIYDRRTVLKVSSLAILCAAVGACSAPSPVPVPLSSDSGKTIFTAANRGPVVHKVLIEKTFATLAEQAASDAIAHGLEVAAEDISRARAETVRIATRSITKRFFVIGDKELVDSVRSKLLGMKTADGITFRINDGTVLLHGTAQTLADRARAERAVWATQGVQHVVNDVRVEKP